VPVPPETEPRPIVNGAKHGEEPWWSPRARADFGGPSRPMLDRLGPPGRAAFHLSWSPDRITIDRAHLLRRLGRHGEAAEAWESIAVGTGRTAILAVIELAKLQEHRLRDRPAAIRTVLRGLAMVERRRQLGRPEPLLEADLRRRLHRLRHATNRAVRRSVA
jgi:hypothetical protein